MSPKWLLAVIGAVSLVAWLAHRGCGGTSDEPQFPVAPSAPAITASAPLAVDSAVSPLDESATVARSSAAAAPTSGSNGDPSLALLSGSLRDPSGKLLTGLWSAGVSVTDATGRRRHADAKETGSFAMAALPYGTYWVSAGADGYHGASATIELDAINADLDANRRHRLWLQQQCRRSIQFRHLHLGASADYL